LGLGPDGYPCLTCELLPPLLRCRDLMSQKGRLFAAGFVWRSQVVPMLDRISPPVSGQSPSPHGSPSLPEVQAWGLIRELVDATGGLIHEVESAVEMIRQKATFLDEFGVEREPDVATVLDRARLALDAAKAFVVKGIGKPEDQP